MNKSKLQVDIIQREHKVIRSTKVTVLSVNRFACASWYSMNGQAGEFQTDINCHKLFIAYAANST